MKKPLVLLVGMALVGAILLVAVLFNGQMSGPNPGVPSSTGLNLEAVVPGNGVSA